MAVYSFFKMQNYRQNKISGSISVIYFTVRHKYCSLLLLKKDLSLEKKAFDLQFLKAKTFLQNSDPFLKGIRKWADLKNDSLSDEEPMHWMPKRFWLRERSHKQNAMNANNLTPKNLFSSYSRTCIWKGWTHLAIVTLPASRIFVSSSKHFKADFTRTEKAITTQACPWDSWNECHAWAVELLSHSSLYFPYIFTESLKNYLDSPSSTEVLIMILYIKQFFSI